MTTVKQVLQPYLDNKQNANKLASQIAELNASFEELNAIPKLDLELDDYTKMQSLEGFIETKETELKKLQEKLITKIGENGIYHNVGYIVASEMASDPQLREAAENFNHAVNLNYLASAESTIEEAEETYLQEYDRVYSEVYSEAEPYINEFIQAHGERYELYLDRLNKFLPKPLTKRYIEFVKMNEGDRARYYDDYVVRVPILDTDLNIPTDFIGLIPFNW